MTAPIRMRKQRGGAGRECAELNMSIILKHRSPSEPERHPLWVGHGPWHCLCVERPSRGRTAAVDHGCPLASSLSVAVDARDANDRLCIAGRDRNPWPRFKGGRDRPPCRRGSSTLRLRTSSTAMPRQRPARPRSSSSLGRTGDCPSGRGLMRTLLSLTAKRRGAVKEERGRAGRPTGWALEKASQFNLVDPTGGWGLDSSPR